MTMSKVRSSLKVVVGRYLFEGSDFVGSDFIGGEIKAVSQYEYTSILRSDSCRTTDTKNQNDIVPKSLHFRLSNCQTCVCGDLSFQLLQRFYFLGLHFTTLLPSA